MARRKSIASLGVTLVARTSGFKKRMKAAKAITKRFSAGIVSGARSLAKMGTAIVAVGSAIAVALIKNQLTAIDKLAKTSKKLGIMTKDLVELRLAAKLTGVPIKALDVGLQRFGRRLSDAAAGNTGLRKTFAELGLDAVQLQTMGVARAFKALAPAFKKQAFATDRVRLAFSLFDTEGVDLVNLMVASGDAFSDAAKDANQFGLVVGNVAARQVENANDSMGRLRDVMTGLFRQAAVNVAPFVEAFSDHFVGIARSGESMEVRVLAAFKGMTVGAAESVSLISGFFTDLQISALQVIDDIGRVSETIGLVTGDISSEKVKHQRKARIERMDAAIDAGADRRNTFDPVHIGQLFDRIISRSQDRAFWGRYNDNQATGGSALKTTNPDVVDAIKTLGNTLRFDVLGGGVAL